MKYALVTGGSRGIGKSISITLAKMGFHVLINYHSNHTEAENTLAEIMDEGGSGELLPYDVASEKATEEVLGKWLEKNNDKTIEVLVNNAGISKDILMMWMTSDDWHKVIDTNMHSFYYTTRALIRDMLVNKYGRIINIVSLSGLKGLPGQVNYSAAKAGVIGATKALAQEVGKKNVTVNAVAPGFIKTEMTEELDEKSLKTMIPLNRFGKPEEVAELVGFLASERSSYITGEIISVNGGLYT